MTAKSNLPPLTTKKIGASTLVVYDDVLRAAGIDPASEPADRPRLVTIKKTMALLSRGRTTIHHMIVAGRNQAAA